MIPVNVITGFLGSGKTTLLRRLLASPAFADCAVLINELGEIGLDHELLEHIDQETILLRSGCLCCSVRTDMQRALVDLHERRARGQVPPFRRVLVETTGLADPAPVLSTVATDPVLRHHYRLGHVVTTVDAVNAPCQFGAHREALRQAAMADRIVITKADLVSVGDLVAVEAAVRELNPTALIAVSANDLEAAQLLLEEDLDGGARELEVARWFSGPPSRHSGASLLAPGKIRLHSPEIGTCSLSLDHPLKWMEFGVWLTMLLHRHGSSILRVKGILQVEGSELPLVVHGVRHLVHAPTHLAGWPGGARASRLVFIGCLPPPAAIEASLQAFGCVAQPRG